MLYKTIVQHLLEQRPQMHEQLRQERKLLKALEIYAAELKESHEALTEQLRQARPGSDPKQISLEAFEMALTYLVDRLPPESQADEHEALSLDQAMAFIRNHSSRG